MRIPRREPREAPPTLVAAEDAARLAAEATARVDGALGAGWYGRPGSAGAGGGAEQGDEAVRQALARARPEALVWLASRAISYMDEHGFPEAVEGELRPEN